jgi:hypothetical protein
MPERIKLAQIDLSRKHIFWTGRFSIEIRSVRPVWRDHAARRAAALLSENCEVAFLFVLLFRLRRTLR